MLISRSNLTSHPSWAAVAIAFAVLALACTANAADGPTGEQIYKSRCASCHGARGEGTADNHPDPLVGEKSIPQLAKLIARTMPKDAPNKCTVEEATQVANYIFDTFYSKAAQAKNKPPRIELSRLTVRQYRNTVADLVGSFGPQTRPEQQHGLRAEYYKGRRFRNNDRVFDRIDPEVRFDFGTSGPDEYRFEPHEFSARWAGSVLAPETGDYEFIIRTEHAARLWLNDTNVPLIDAWVKSGNDTEYRATIYLLAGRTYPLRMEFSKAKQGVDDSKTQKKKPQSLPASVALLWKLPNRTAEVIPSRNLFTSSAPRRFVPTTPFPPDDRSAGYERGTAISKAWDQATTEGAIEVAGYVSTQLRELAGVADDAKNRDARLRDFCKQFAERAFRRPLTAEEKTLYVDHQFEQGRADSAVKRSVLLTLKSPRFLYREIGSAPDAYAVASRISYALWDSLPDQELLRAAAAGQLATREHVARQAERMIDDPRSHSKIREFFFQWLKVDQLAEISKDRSRFPEFDQATVSDLRTSLDLLLDDVIWSQASDFRQLFLADYLHLNGRLARLYGVALPADAPFLKFAQDPQQRAGVLSHPYLMSAFAYTGTSSPIHRGVFLARSVLGQALRPPPDAFTPLPEEAHPEFSTRERVAYQTRAQACQSCHSMINPLGFSLEHFDAIGRYRDKERGKPIDATGVYIARSGETASFAGVRELALFLASSEETHEAFVAQLFHYLVKQPIRAFGPNTLEDLRRSFVKHDFNMRKLMIECIVVAALRGERSP